MGAIQTPGPVKLICGVLRHAAAGLAEIEEALAREFGPIDLRSDTWPFRFTSYYEQETGPDIQRTFVAFHNCVDPAALADAKTRTNALEAGLAERLSVGVARPVNLDPGYVDSAKLVLATTKDHSHRLYLGRGIYGEVTLRFHKGRFEPWPWTYPDYRTPEYVDFFGRVRARYLQQRRGEA
jgi:hypothetical protein